MALRSRTYLDAPYTEERRRLLKGGPRRNGTKKSFEAFDHPWFTGRYGSHMPLDVDPHWTWRNPLNIIPAFLLVLLVFALIGMIF